MRDPPRAASTPLKGQVGRPDLRNGAKNRARRSVSLLDVSAIEAPRDTSKKSESNETLTSICKDSGYVQSEGSYLEEEEEEDAQESVKDLIKELKFKNVLISELQESNRGLRLRCADAENKIWRLRIKCESHCGCCEAKNGNVLDDDRFRMESEEIIYKSNKKIDSFPKDFCSWKRYSLASSKVELLDKTKTSEWKASSFDQSSKKMLPRSSSLDTIALVTAPKRHADLELKGALTNNQRIEDLSLSKVKRWQRDLQVSTNSPSAIEVQSEEDDSQFTDSHSSSAYQSGTCDDGLFASKPSTLFQDLDFLTKQNDKPEGISKSELVLERPAERYENRVSSGWKMSFGDLKQHRKDVRNLTCHSQYSDVPEEQNNLVNSHVLNNSINFPSAHETSSHVASIASAPLPISHHSSSFDPKNSHLGRVSDCSYCKISATPTQIIIVPNGCCCRAATTCSHQPCSQNHLHSGTHERCSQNCNYSQQNFELHHACSSCMEDTKPRNTPTHCALENMKHKHRSTLHVKSDDTTSQKADKSPSNRKVAQPCKCASSFSCPVVPLPKRLDTNADLRQRIEEGVGKIVSDSKAEIDSLRFKPWPPPELSKMSRVMQCLAETSHYAQQVAIASSKIYRTVHRLS